MPNPDAAAAQALAEIERTTAMQFVVMLDRSAGNESVGEMWTETKVFDADATLAEVEEWIRTRVSKNWREPLSVISHNVRLQVAQ